MKLYEEIADEIAQSILDGLLLPGDKLPSVRQASLKRKVSQSTIFEAYYLLEAQGLLVGKERSGYYVATSRRQAPPEPEAVSLPDPESITLDVSERVFELLSTVVSRDLVPLGSAFPSPCLFPMARLAKLMATSIHDIDPWSAVDNITPGSMRLRRQIALRYLIDGLHIHTNELVVTNGALEALNLCLSTVTRPGDAVMIESPTFYAALQSIERNGLRAIEVQTHPNEGMDLGAAERAILQHRPKACWLMTNFQNPLGSIMPDAKKQALVRLLAQHQIPLIEDDVYGELYFGEQRPTPAKAYDTEGLVMHCSSFSKCLAPGYRVGWVAPGRYFNQLARNKLTTNITTSEPVQAALALYLEKGGYDRHLRQLRAALARQQTVYADAVARYFPQGTRATRPKGGYFLWIELPAGVDALKVHQEALANGISIAPGPLFSAHSRFDNSLRLNYGHPWDSRVEAAMQTLGHIVAAAARTTGSHAA